MAAGVQEGVVEVGHATGWADMEVQLGGLRAPWGGSVWPARVARGRRKGGGEREEE